MTWFTARLAQHRAPATPLQLLHRKPSAIGHLPGQQPLQDCGRMLCRLRYWDYFVCLRLRDVLL